MKNDKEYLNKKRSRSNSVVRDTEPNKKQKLDLSETFFKTLLEVNSKVQCSICTQDITKVIKIVCNQCNITHCLDCLITGKTSDHTKHDYNIINRLTFPIFTSEWAAAEELLLLTGKIK
jgi:hypothetical protein